MEGGGFFLYVLSGVSFEEFLANISGVLMDESHDQSLKEMWIAHLQALGEMLIPTFLVIMLSQVVLRTGKKASDKKKLLVLAGGSLGQAGLFVYQFHTITKVNYIIFLPLILQFGVYLLYVHWILTRDDEVEVQDEVSKSNNMLSETEHVGSNLLVRKNENRLILLGLGMPSLVAFVIVLSSSNLSADYSTGFLVPFVLAVLMILAREIKSRSNSENGIREKGAYKVLVLSISLLLFVFAVLLLTTRIFLVRFTSTQRKNIFEGYYETNHGPLKGIRLGETDYHQYEAKSFMLTSLVTEEDVFMYVGCDMFLYSQFNGKIGTGNTISTPVFGEQLLHYYEKYPERMPNIFFVDREYVSDFDVVLHKEPFASFVAENYVLDLSYEGAPVSVYRKCEHSKIDPSS